jgi:hypothetical protein
MFDALDALDKATFKLEDGYTKDIDPLWPRLIDIVDKFGMVPWINPKRYNQEKLNVANANVGSSSPQLTLVN